MKNKYILPMIMIFSTLTLGVVSTIIHIVRQNIDNAIFSFIVSILFAMWFGILVVAVIQENDWIKTKKRFEETLKKFLEVGKKNQENQIEPFIEFKDGSENGKDGQGKTNSR